MYWLLLLWACDGDGYQPRPTYDDPDTADQPVDLDPYDPGTSCEGPCPCDMVAVGPSDAPLYCIDAYEDQVVPDGLGNADQGAGFPDGSTLSPARSVAGMLPTVNVTFYQAVAACEVAGKHLCTPAEWTDACDGTPGEGGTVFPWGDEPLPDEVCAAAHADGTTDIPGLAETGAYPACRTPSGVYDLAGNAWEWVDPQETGEDGLPVTGKVGGAWYAGGGSTHCGDAPNTEHPPSFEGTIGVRCCFDL